MAEDEGKPTADEAADPTDAAVVILDAEEVIQSALEKARESLLADEDLIRILSDYLARLDPGDSPVEDTAAAIEQLAKKRAREILRTAKLGEGDHA